MARAQGKVILCGEHAVVHGCPALAVGIERGVEAVAERTETSRLSFGEEAVTDARTLAAYQALLERLAPGAAVRTRVQLELPPGVGLGASAAVAVAIARAVFELERTPTEDDTAALLDAANAWEGVFHGNPSGVDTACALFGGCIRFQKGRPVERIRLREPLELLVAVAGPALPTHQMVSAVARIREQHPARFQQNLEAIRAIVDNARHCLLEGDRIGLGKLFDHNHMLLASWLLSTNEIERALRAARDGGALGAKLTGGGGGGCIIALPAPGGGQAILDAWERLGLPCFATRVS